MVQICRKEFILSHHAVLGSIMVSVMDSHSCNRCSTPGQLRQSHIRYALNTIQFI